MLLGIACMGKGRDFLFVKWPFYICQVDAFHKSLSLKHGYLEIKHLVLEQRKYLTNKR